MKRKVIQPNLLIDATVLESITLWILTGLWYSEFTFSIVTGMANGT